MRTNVVYAIYWVPAGFTTSANYRSLIDGFFQDIAADSGKTTNVYSTDTQYFDGTGNIAYNSTFGGSIVDAQPFPASGCSDGVDSVCLDDQQLRTELLRVIGVQGWPQGFSYQYFIFTPQGVGSCFQGYCAYSAFCAYHSAFGDSTHAYIYANQPFLGVAGCQTGQRPNGDIADDTINVVSHEHNEAITDPLLDAWYAASGNENGDNCAWNFGVSMGGSPGQQYNQVINGNHYYLQGEWSNATSSCAWAYAGASILNTGLPLILGTVAVGQSVNASTGTWTGSPTSFSYQWLRCAADGSSCAFISGASGSSYLVGGADAYRALRVSVTASDGTGADTAMSNASVVVNAPANTSLPVISGTATVGQTLSTSTGMWSASPTGFAYQWLRCAADGSSCTPIGGATGSAYVLVTADANQTVRTSVTASNGAGSGPAAFTVQSEVVAGAPVDVTLPTISGSANLGAPLVASPGSWTAARPIVFAYQWLRCDAQGSSCVPIFGVTDTSYVPGVVDMGSTLRVTVTASSASFSVAELSTATDAVTEAHRAAPPAPAPQQNRLPPPPTPILGGVRPLPPVRR